MTTLGRWPFPAPAGICLLWVAIGVAAVALVQAQEPTTSDPDQPTVERGAAEESAPRLSLADVPTKRIAFEKTSREIKRKVDDRQNLDELREQLADFEAELQPILQRATPGAVAQIPVSELMDLASTLLSIEGPLTETTQELDTQARSLEADLSDLQQLDQQWKDFADVTDSLRAPEELMGQVRETQDEISELTLAVENRRNETLNLLAKASGLSAAVTDFRSETTDYERRVRRETLLSEDQSLWRLRWQRTGESLFRHLWLQLKADTGHLVSYLQFNAPRILVTFLAPLGLILFWLKRLKVPAQKMADEDPYAALALRVIDPSWPIALILSILITIWLSPPAPQIYYQVLLFVIPVPAAVFVLKTHGTSIRVSAWTIAIALALLTLRTYLELSPLLDRLVLIAQCASVSAALAWDLKHGNWPPALGGRWARIQLWILKLFVVLLALTALLAIVGQVGLARELRSGILGSLGFALVFGGLFRALDSLANTWIRSASAKSHPVIRHYPRMICLYIRRILFAATLAAWIATSLYAFEIYGEAMALVRRILDSGLRIRALDITIGDVLTFVLVIGASFISAKIIRLLLEEEILPKFHLKRGLPYAISTVTRYIILVVGFTMALAAVGIDLSKATLLAGAFGIGIGFGLQNVVNNFVSGLILLFERPVQVGDAIEVGNLLGEVTRIGIRASTVRTFQGAEVIVPNGELISNQVVNWTFSNRRRRVEIAVGVAYGTDPQKVIQLLLDTAKSHPRVDNDPPPSVLFTDFGDSSLDFQLRSWVNVFEEGVSVGSELRVAIDQALKDAGIEIPFPQRDLHIRSKETDQPALLEISEESATE